MRKKTAALKAHHLYYLVLALLCLSSREICLLSLSPVLKRKNTFFFLEAPQNVFYYWAESCHVVLLVSREAG